MFVCLQRTSDISGDVVVNLRENVIDQRIKYSVSAVDEANRQGILHRAVRSVGHICLFLVILSHVAA